MRKKAEEYKTEGNNFFRKKKYEDAIKFYDKAIDTFKFDGYFYSNKAAA